MAEDKKGKGRASEPNDGARRYPRRSSRTLTAQESAQQDEDFNSTIDNAHQQILGDRYNNDRLSVTPAPPRYSSRSTPRGTPSRDTPPLFSDFARAHRSPPLPTANAAQPPRFPTQLGPQRGTFHNTERQQSVYSIADDSTRSESPLPARSYGGVQREPHPLQPAIANPRIFTEQQPITREEAQYFVDAVRSIRFEAASHSLMWDTRSYYRNVRQTTELPYAHLNRLAEHYRLPEDFADAPPLDRGWASVPKIAYLLSVEEARTEGRCYCATCNLEYGSHEDAQMTGIDGNEEVASVLAPRGNTRPSQTPRSLSLRQPSPSAALPGVQPSIEGRRSGLRMPTRTTRDRANQERLQRRDSDDPYRLPSTPVSSRRASSVLPSSSSVTRQRQIDAGNDARSDERSPRTPHGRGRVTQVQSAPSRPSAMNSRFGGGDPLQSFPRHEFTREDTAETSMTFGRDRERTYPPQVVPPGYRPIAPASRLMGPPAPGPITRPITTMPSGSPGGRRTTDRRPEATGAYYSSRVPPSMELFMNESRGPTRQERGRLSHIGRIEETTAGQLRSRPCKQCREGNHVCKEYTPAALQEFSGNRAFNKCSRCRFRQDKCDP